MDTDTSSAVPIRGRDVAHGAARGAVAAMAMTGVRAVTGGLRLVEQTPPQAMMPRLGRRLLGRVPRRDKDAVIELAHWGYGAGGGAAYALLPAAYRSRSWGGVAYGLVLWLGYETLLAPVLGIAGTRRRGVRERLAVGVDHFLYGLVVSEIRPAHKAQR